MGYFSSLRKVIKKTISTFFLLLQKEPKSRRGSALRPRFKIPSGELLIKLQAVCLSRNFVGNHGLVPYSSEDFEPVRGGEFTAQGFVGVYKKVGFDLGGQ